MTDHSPRFLLRPALLSLFVALAVGACASDRDNWLHGSLTDKLDMSFDHVRILRSADQMAIQYLRDRDGGMLIPFKLIAIGVTDVQTRYLDGNLMVGRQMGGDDPMTMPTLQSGKLECRQPPVADARIKGRFDLLLTDGSSLSGGFGARVESTGL